MVSLILSEKPWPDMYSKKCGLFVHIGHVILSMASLWGLTCVYVLYVGRCMIPLEWLHVPKRLPTHRNNEPVIKQSLVYWSIIMVVLFPDTGEHIHCAEVILTFAMRLVIFCYILCSWHYSLEYPIPWHFLINFSGQFLPLSDYAFWKVSEQA